MRVNVYAEEMTDRLEIIAKTIDGHDFTGLRFYLELPATVGGVQHQAPFMHRPGDDDSAAVTFWGKRDLRRVLGKAQQLLDAHYEAKGVAAPGTLVPPAPGELWPGQGGYYICTLPAIGNLPARHLIAHADSHKGLKWGDYGVDTPGASSRFDGAANTSALLAHGKHPAAKWAAERTADGHSDFHLPSQLDLFMAQMYAPQLFKEGTYWSSTQVSSASAFVQYFALGHSDWHVKDIEFRVRAFRTIQL